jgi:hypothetical protein
MLVAAPSLATLGPLDDGDDPGIFLADIWHKNALKVFGMALDPDIAHCPLLAATEGLSHDITAPSMQTYLADANPIFFPQGELICSTVTLDPSNTTYRAFFLPEICSPPICLAWPLNISLDAFVESITALGKAYKPFLLCVEALTPALTVWFPAVSAHPDAFLVPACKYTKMEQHFPSLTTSTYRTVITNSRGFSPLLDMRYGLAWRLHCDRVLATTIGPGLPHFQTFLHRGEAGITESTYLRAAIPSQFCPNFGHHFQTVNKVWPTPVDPLPPFADKSQVSLDAQDYAIITLDVHGD